MAETQEVELRRLAAEDCIIVNKQEMRKVQIGTGVGNFMEWYDFGIYGYLAVTMATVFTTGMSESMALLVSLAGFAVSFLVRPLGGLILGPLGDKIGRQKILFLTIALMAVSTALIGLLPTAETIGIWAVILLYILKMTQGFAVGGEYSGASTYISEFSADKRRGLATSWLNSQSFLGFAAGSGVVALTTWFSTSQFGETAMVDGWWRLPFLLAIPLGAITIWFRTRVPESPAFIDDSKLPTGLPVNSVHRQFGPIGILKNYWPAVLIGCALTAADSTLAYMVTSYMPTYLETEVGISSLNAAVALIPIMLIIAAAIPVAARISDKVGRKPVYKAGCLGSIILIIPAYTLLLTGELWAIFVAMLIIAVPNVCYLALTGAALPALFPTASRYGGMGMTHNIALSAVGGTTPFFCQLLLQSTGNEYAPAFYVMFFSTIGLIAAFKMKETAGRPLLGSVPVVETIEEAHEIARTQDHNELVDTSTMPIFKVPAPPKTSARK